MHIAHAPLWPDSANLVAQLLKWEPSRNLQFVLTQKTVTNNKGVDLLDRRTRTTGITPD